MSRLAHRAHHEVRQQWRLSGQDVSLQTDAERIRRVQTMLSAWLEGAASDGAEHADMAAATRAVIAAIEWIQEVREDEQGWRDRFLAEHPGADEQADAAIAAVHPLLVAGWCS